MYLWAGGHAVSLSNAMLERFDVECNSMPC
jgi:hypothetical protein